MATDLLSLVMCFFNYGESPRKKGKELVTIAGESRKINRWNLSKTTSKPDLPLYDEGQVKLPRPCRPD